MYSTVTFDIKDLSAGISFFRTCSRAGLSRIRRLQIHHTPLLTVPALGDHANNEQYCEFWGLVAFCLPSLRDLHFCLEVKFVRRYDLEFHKRWPGWAIPILYVRGLRSCEFTVEMERWMGRGVSYRRVVLDYPELIPLRQKCLEDMKEIVCRQPGRKADFSRLFLGQTFPQDERNALMEVLKDRYLTALPPDSERETRVSGVSVGILRSELYQPDTIPAHRDHKDITRQRADGNSYANNIIEWLVQKVSSFIKRSTTVN